MEPFNKNKTILDKDTVSNTLTTSLRNTLTKQKKPVRFTWKGAADLFATMSNTPLRNVNLRSLMDKSLPRVTDLAEGRDKPKEKDYIDFFEDMEKSIFGAAQNIGYSIGDLLTTGTDLALDTNLTEKLDKAYEENKNDGLWLQRAMNRLYTKECSDDPLFVKIVEQKNTLEPNASTAYYLGILKDKEGDSAAALTYYNQAVELETDNIDKGNILYRIAAGFKSKRSYGQARTYYQKALAANPSMGRAHLAIAQMYAASANNCGSTVFEKRAIYWKATEMASKAARVDGSIAANARATAASYLGLAPQKSDIFDAGLGGQTITFKCWVGGSVKVPNL